MKLDFHPHFSDNSAHNKATTFERIKTFVHCMYDNNVFINNGIIYGTTDGCIKQYICGNATWVLSVMEFT